MTTNQAQRIAAEARTLERLPIVAEEWQVGALTLPVSDGTAEVHAVVDEANGHVRALAAASAVDVVFEALRRPPAPGLPGRPRRLVCATGAIAEALRPLDALFAIRVGPTPTFDVIAEQAQREIGNPGLLGPTARLEEWGAAMAELVGQRFWTRDQTFRITFPTGERRAAHTVVAERLFVLEPPDDGIGDPAILRLTAESELDAYAVERFRRDGLVVQGFVPLVLGADADGHGPLAEREQSELLDALIAAMRHDPVRDALAPLMRPSPDVRVGPVTVPERPGSDAGFRVEPLFTERALTFARIARDGGERIPRIVVKLVRSDARRVAPRFAPIDRIVAVATERAGERAIVGFTGEDPLGVVGLLLPSDVERLGDAAVVVLAVAEGGVHSPTVTTKQILGSRRVRLERR